jgi:hypothetical protein
MSMRTYLLIALVFGGILYLVHVFFGPDIVNWAQSQRFQAQIRGQNAIGVIVMDPIIFVLGVSPWGAIVGGLAWPVVILWVILTPLLLVIIAGLDVVADIERELWRGLMLT